MSDPPIQQSRFLAGVKYYVSKEFYNQAVSFVESPTSIEVFAAESEV
jgi:hypothetical protein